MQRYQRVERLGDIAPECSTYSYVKPDKDPTSSERENEYEKERRLVETSVRCGGGRRIVRKKLEGD